ncbi:GTP-binding protein [Helicobacter didelphidarum]|uniref:GTP-binding protein n=1 Tax=Helicobacter didelphidarum TaxID=2040648 RepID=A0A3D8IRA9_9HELI|nr:DUF697 domain-containing protein [Helicobacter didelphidarum]RDU67456.1 GTP-binding protein [Helicobacter didelphidarum]
MANQQEFSVNMGDVMKKAYGEMKKDKNENLNVLILGKTGIGKTTLIRAIFGDNVPEGLVTGSGKPITQEIKSYKVSDDFTLYDSKGLEVKDYAAIKDDIERFLQQKSREDVDKQIHIAWLCIAESGRRIEVADKEIWNLLQKYQIPSLVAITKAERDKDEHGEKFSDIVKRTLQVNDDRMERVRALSIEDDDGERKPLMGINEIIQKSYKILPEARKLAFARKQTYDNALRKEAAKKQAQTIINRYSVAAGAVAATPIPFADFAILLPTQCAMIIHISNIYGLDISLESAKKVIPAFVAVAGVGFAAKVAVGSVLKFVPFIGTLTGGAINATVAGTTTKAMGELYIAYLDDNFDNLQEAFNNITAEALKSIQSRIG